VEIISFNVIASFLIFFVPLKGAHKNKKKNLFYYKMALKY